MDLKLYTTIDEQRVVNKTLDNEKVYTNVCLKGDVDIINPTVLISGIDIDTITEFNYMYIPKFHRYYYINSIGVSTGKMVAISGHIDVLYSFRNDIKKSENMVARYNQKTNKSKYLVDNNLPTDVRKKIITREFGTELHNSNDYFVLSVSEGIKKNIS